MLFRSWRGEAGRIYRLAWPVSTGMLGLVGMSAVDTLMVGHLGERPMASVAIASSWFFGLNVVGFGVLRALDPVLSQAFGARDQKAIHEGVVRGVAMALIMVPPLIVTQLLAGPALRALHQPPELLPDAAAWCAAAAIGIPGNSVANALRQSLQALGVVRPAAAAVLVANLFNFAFNLLFLYGLHLGPVGAGLATALSQYVLAGFTAWFGRETLAPCLPHWRTALALGPLLRLIGIGVPLGFQLAMEAWAFHLSALMMGWISVTAVAANAAVLNLCTLSFMVPLGVSAAASTRVGNLVGAGLPWTFAARVSLVLGAGLMAGSASMFTLFPETLARFYTSDAEVVALAVTLLPIAAAFQLFDGIQVVAFAVLRGVGDLKLPVVANIVGYWALGLPLGAWLAFRGGWGPRGVFAGVAIGVVCVAVLLLGRVAWIARTGRAVRVEG